MSKFDHEVYPITSVDDCLRKCDSLKTSAVGLRKSIHPEDEMKFFYRGERNINWDTMPSVFRDRLYEMEDKLIRDALLSRPEEFNTAGSEPFETLVKMQHFGLPTRLLDITSNPLVALYFACLPYDDNDREQDGKFVFFAGFPLLPSSNRAIILANYAYSKLDPCMCREELTAFYSVSKKLENLGVIFPYRCLDDGLKGLYFYYTEVINRDAIILPALKNERIKRQNGAFVIFGNNNPFFNVKLPHMLEDSDPEGFDFFFCIIAVKADKKSEILNTLNEMGINESYLFPELEYSMKEIKNHYKKAISNRQI